MFCRESFGVIKQNDDFSYEYIKLDNFNIESGICNYKDNIVFIGGKCYKSYGRCNGYWTYEDTCSLFDTDTEKVQNFPYLVVQRANPAVVYFNQKLMVIGGKFGEKPLKSIEVFDEENNRWMLKSIFLNDARSKHSAVECNGKLYIVGGDEECCINSIEVFSPESDCFEKLSSTNFLYKPYCWFVHENSIWRIGGKSTKESAERSNESLQRYDVAEDAWHVESPFPIFIEDVGVCIVSRDF